MSNNDLISREYLRDAFDNLCCHNCKTCRNFRKEGCSFYRCDLIDNAPTVNDCPNCEYKLEADYIRSSSSYKELIDLRKFKEENTRPQGEWIRTGSLENGNAHYECSNCHHGDEHAESQEVPYCWFCGAKMKGGAENGKD